VQEESGVLLSFDSIEVSLVGVVSHSPKGFLYLSL